VAGLPRLPTQVTGDERAWPRIGLSAHPRMDLALRVDWCPPSSEAGRLVGLAGLVWSPGTPSEGQRQVAEVREASPLPPPEAVARASGMALAGFPASFRPACYLPKVRELSRAGKVPRLDRRRAAEVEDRAAFAREPRPGKYWVVQVLALDRVGWKGAHIPWANASTPSGGIRSKEESTNRQPASLGCSTGSDGCTWGRRFARSQHIRRRSAPSWQLDKLARSVG